jgi:hypothetical protein
LSCTNLVARLPRIKIQRYRSNKHSARKRAGSNGVTRRMGYRVLRTSLHRFQLHSMTELLSYGNTNQTSIQFGNWLSWIATQNHGSVGNRANGKASSTLRKLRSENTQVHLRLNFDSATTKNDEVHSPLHVRVWKPRNEANGTPRETKTLL